jgi:hypothetical protein
MSRRTSGIGSRQGSRSAKQSGQKLAPKPLCESFVADPGNGRLGHVVGTLLKCWFRVASGLRAVIYAPSGLVSNALLVIWPKVDLNKWLCTF